MHQLIEVVLIKGAYMSMRHGDLLRIYGTATYAPVRALAHRQLHRLGKYHAAAASASMKRATVEAALAIEHGQSAYPRLPQRSTGSIGASSGCARAAPHSSCLTCRNASRWRFKPR